MLVDRVATLIKERDESMVERLRSDRKVVELTSEIASHRDVGQDLCDKISELEKVNTRMSGWQDCAREIFDKDNAMFREVGP